MRYLVFLLYFLSSAAALSDDSLINPVAKKIKDTVIKGLNKSHVDMNGYCDLMIEMKHSKGYTRIKNVRTSGDSKVCKQAKKHLPKKKKFKYSFPEKYIRIQVMG
ncbi:hypothetical protein L1D37_13540 [Vibrio sp. Isolate33]|uniref:hypothetical protein n=1 Tax=Vibrio sp. Isolate33 TaxID=2908539 RepID=UPI001EFCC2C4|nr:hypothetical protein [Vibrio sp. Isolate33]MCG9544789.1 hypothetical protein [Vibrio sp. Isolate33]